MARASSFATGRATRGRAGRGPRSCWSTAWANTPAATSTSATRWPPPASTSTPTTTAGTAGRAGGAATSIAGSSTTTTLPSGSSPSAAQSGGRPVVLYGHSMGGLVVLGYLLTDRPRPDLVVLSSPALDSTLAGVEEDARTDAVPDRADPRDPERDRRQDAVARPVRRATRSAADPLATKSSTTRFGAEALAEQARVRRDYGGPDAADARAARPR